MLNSGLDVVQTDSHDPPRFSRTRWDSELNSKNKVVSVELLTQLPIFPMIDVNDLRDAWREISVFDVQIVPYDWLN